MFDKEDEDFLAYSVFLRVHAVVWMGYEAWLKDGCEVGCRHEICCRVFGEDSEKIKDVEEELSVEFRQFTDQSLVHLNCLFNIPRVFLCMSTLRVFCKHT